MAKANVRFRLVWSSSRSDWLIAPETAVGIGAPATATAAPVSVEKKSANKTSMLQRLGVLPLSIAMAMMFAGVAPGVVAQALQDPAVRSGAATIDLTNANHAVITQQSNKAIIDWRQFSIPAGSTVQFVQPNSSSMMLNRVTGSQASQIDGSLLANGQVWLLNPSGVMIGNGGSVNTASFLASTLDIKNNDFLNGRYRFDATSHTTGKITNAGTIKAAENGYVVLSGSQISNEGLIEAKLGSVLLGSGQAMTLDLVGDKLLSFSIDAPVNALPADGHAVIENSGRITAQGGKVVMTARTATDVMHSVINVSGVVEATSARLVNGEIILDGGTTGSVNVSGSLLANGMQTGETGGAIKVFGKDIQIANSARLDARGDAGGGVIHVGGGWQGSDMAGHTAAVTTRVASGAVLDASAIRSGNGGEIAVWSDIHNKQSVTAVSGTLLATGGAYAGNGGRIETSGYLLGTTGIKVNASALHGKNGLWLLDPTDITISPVSGAGITLDSTITSALTNGTVAEIIASGSINLASGTNISGSSNTMLYLHAGQNISMDHASIGVGSLSLIADNGRIEVFNGSTINTFFPGINMSGSTLSGASATANSSVSVSGSYLPLNGISLFAIAYDSIKIDSSTISGIKIVAASRGLISTSANTSVTGSEMFAYSDTGNFSLLHTRSVSSTSSVSASGNTQAFSVYTTAEEFEAAIEAFIGANETVRQAATTVTGAISSIQNQLGQPPLAMQTMQQPVLQPPPPQQPAPQPNQPPPANQAADATVPPPAQTANQTAQGKPPPKDGVSPDAPAENGAPPKQAASNEPAAPNPATNPPPRQTASNASSSPQPAPAPQSPAPNNAGAGTPPPPAGSPQLALAAPPPPVAPPPPSPVAIEKPPTPKDAADSGDRTLAMAAPPPPPKPATQSQASATRTSVVSPGLVEIQLPIPPRPPSGAAAEQPVPTMGNSARW